MEHARRLEPDGLYRLLHQHRFENRDPAYGRPDELHGNRACQRHAIHILRAGRLRRKHLELRGHYGQTVDLAVPRHRPGDRSRRCLRHAHVVEAFNDGALLYALLLQRGRHRRRDGTAPRQGCDRHHAGQPGQRQELLLLVSGQLCQGNLRSGHRQGHADPGHPLQPRPRQGSQESAHHLHVQHRGLPDGHRCQMDFPGRCRQAGHGRQIRPRIGRHADRETERDHQRQRTDLEPRGRDPRIRRLQHRLGAGRLELQRLQRLLSGILARRENRLHHHVQQGGGPTTCSR